MFPCNGVIVAQGWLAELKRAARSAVYLVGGGER
ncbi:hypothetical protein Sinac_2990 [Singulisphaera acidiphila DSM 18658]|uniref:Uncharacterized protein n=1 Tax=Singulisphaera acidiphila (strain ATCC BAA-1392 / DSM 18658 / VKM B-2454 / MOB10) TaxID=886293 RepID=L0DEM7_SINAD|nr:hypothetical protein Sinac_2990 [Singulisphaera acidiphila DSM 18658]